MLNAADFPATLPVCADAVARTPQHELPYLQILPPFELLASPLYAQIDALARLYTAGRSVCAAVVGNGAAFEAGEDAEIIDVVYDPAGRTAPQDLLAAAEALGGQAPQPLSGSLIHPLPARPQLRLARMLLWRPHLPDGVLRARCVPVLAAEGVAAVTLLPARYWAHTPYYRQWVAAGQGLDAAAAFTALLAQEPVFWKGFADAVRPTAAELPTLGSVPGTAFQAADDARGKQFVRNCRWQAGRSYGRSSEQGAGDDAVMAAAKKLVSGQNAGNDGAVRYAKLRLADFGGAFAELADDALNRLLGSRTPDKIHQAVQSGRLNAQQTPALVAALLRLYNSGQANAAVYLAYLYGKGLYVPQSLREAAAWARRAAAAGDWRGLRLHAEMVLAAPEAAPELLSADAEEQAAAVAWPQGKVPDERKIATAVSQFLVQDPAVKQMARAKLLQAAQAGHPHAEARIAELVAQGTLTAAPPAPQYSDIAIWLNNRLQPRSSRPAVPSEEDDIVVFPENMPELMQDDEDPYRQKFIRLGIAAAFGLFLAVVMVVVMRLIA